MRDCILNAVESNDEDVANDKLGYDEEKVDRKLIKNKKILPVFPAQASMVCVTEANGGEEDPHSSDEVCVQRSKANCKSCNQQLTSYVKILRFVRIIFIPVKSQVETDSSSDCILRIIIVPSFVQAEREVATKS